MEPSLPAGQRAWEEFPRFGMPALKTYRGDHPPSGLRIKGEVERPMEISFAEFSPLPRTEQVSDLHCVTTWSYCGVRWSGYRFRDVFHQLIEPLAQPHPTAQRVVFKAADGYWASLLLEDALAPDVLLANQMEGEPLSLDHGSPMRLIAPAHYGYKNVKHLAGLEFRTNFKPGAGILEHPRARVAFEERGRLLPQKLLRYLYRPLIGTTIRYLKTDR